MSNSAPRSSSTAMVTALLLLAGSVAAFAAPHVSRDDSGQGRFGGSQASAFEPDSSCSGGNLLSGEYGMLVTGSGKYLSGALLFDGSCNVSGANITGGLTGAYTTSSVAGTYSQNSDGTVALTLNFANPSSTQTFVIGVSESGYKARGIESDNSVEAVIDLQSQVTSLSSGYTAASLSGSYVASCSGADITDFNILTFDGAGNVSVIDDPNGKGKTTLTGTYTVNGDGTYLGTLAGSYSFNGVIETGVSQIEYIYASGGSGIYACLGKRAQSSPNLSGYYGFVEGETLGSSAPGEYFAGSLDFNGSGGVNATNVYGGSGGAYGDTTATGSYTVNSDNSVNLTLNLKSPAATQTYIVGVAEAGNELLGVQTDGSAVATIDLQAQLQLPGTAYSNASLAGTYSASCAGSGIDLNYVTFDGKGEISAGVDAYYNGGYGDNPYTGFYTVNSDGTFTSGFNGSIYDVYNADGVIDNATGEIEFTYDLAGTGGVVGCIGESTFGPIGSGTVAATPTFSPAPGAFTSGPSVSLSDSTSGAVIHYTTNGTPPTVDSPVYSSAIPVNATTTIQAIAVANGDNNSAIAAGTYFLTSAEPTAATPTFNPAPGSFSSAQSVTLADTTSGATIYYTINGTTPTSGSTKYTGAIAVSSTTTIEAIAIATGYNNSGVATGTYTISQPTAATPTFSPAPGTYTSVQSVTLSDTTSGATIYYTTNGSAPTTSSTNYTGAITVSAATTIEAIAVATGYNNSGVATGTYTIGQPTAATPTFSPAPGTYTSVQSVTLSDTTSGATIYYTTNGSAPTTSSTNYTGAITVSAATTIEAIAVATGYNNSGVATGTYTISAPTAQPPAFNPAPGTYNSAQKVTLNSTTTGAAIYYTTNDTTPTTGSTKYTGAINVTGTTTIEAIAVASGYNNSPVASGTYTITLPPAAAPTFSPTPGSYTGAQSVTLSDTTSGAAIYYTTNGTTPTASSTKYSGAINVSATTTIEAIAVASGYSSSSVASGVFTIVLPPAQSPLFSPLPGSFTSATAVTLSDLSDNATIHYTTNGSTPTTSSPVYSKPINVSATTTIEAIAVASGYSSSPVASGQYLIGKPQSITFPAIPTEVQGAGPVALTATASSGLKVSYSIVSGPATVSSNKLTITGPGTVTVQANQAGNSNYAPAQPVQQSFTVLATTTTTISSSSNPSIVGTMVTFTARVTSSLGPPPDGETISFEQGTTLIGAGATTGGQTTFSTNSLGAGTDQIRAVYLGDSTLNASTSAVLNQVVNSKKKTSAPVVSKEPVVVTKQRTGVEPE